MKLSRKKLILAGFLFVGLALLGSSAACASAKSAKNVSLKVGGESIGALYWAPPASAKSAPGVILLHMLGWRKEDWSALGDFLQKNGYAAIAVDLRDRGNGGREKLVADARAAYDFLRLQKEVDASRVAAIGGSIGANGALWFAATEPAIKAVVLLSPGLNYYGVTSEDAMTRFGARPVLLVASEDDDYSAATVRRLAQLAKGPHPLKVFDNAGHGTQMLGAGVGLDRLVLQFLQQNL